MSDRKIPVITISREYGAFGRTIAEKVAASLSLPLYGRDEIIQRVAKESGYSEDDIRKESEQMS
ncbi:MAG: cytidylate kinase family protein, partial [Lachnospiraceae bacterium]|nr:cytidylate kinase family protein [Lachnospiraceae bacterium]